MPQQVRWRRQTTVGYQENGTASEKLQRGMIYRELYLKLSYTLDADAGAAITNANTMPGGEFGVIKNIKIVANGTDVIRNISGEELSWLNMFQFGARRRLDANLANGIGVGTSEAITASLILPFWTPRSVRPFDTALDARRLSNLDIEITWGDVADVTSAASAAFSVDPSLLVYSLESFGVDGPFSQTKFGRIVENSYPINDEARIDLPVGAMYRGFLINTKDADTHDGPNYLNNIKIVSGTTVFFDMNADLLQNITLNRLGILETHDDAAGAIDNFFISDESDYDAWYYIDLVTDGFLSEAIDTLGFSELKLELDVNTQCNLTVISNQVIPIRKKG